MYALNELINEQKQLMQYRLMNRWMHEHVAKCMVEYNGYIDIWMDG